MPFSLSGHFLRSEGWGGRWGEEGEGRALLLASGDGGPSLAFSDVASGYSEPCQPHEGGSLGPRVGVAPRGFLWCLARIELLLSKCFVSC